MAIEKEEPPSAEIMDALKLLTEKVTEHFNQEKPVVTLDGPQSLTVTLAGKGFSKAKHIGGENFIADKVYIGKRNKLIFVFKPEAASAYLTMEMDESQARAHLTGIVEVLDEAAGGSFADELIAIRRKESMAREAIAVKDKFEVYPVFGTW